VRLAIEVDLHPTHSETDGRRRDAARDAAAGQIGWAVERVVEVDFGDALPVTTRRILALAATRRSER
jgi:very-short-patch-repair endonuclease